MMKLFHSVLLVLSATVTGLCHAQTLNQMVQGSILHTSPLALCWRLLQSMADAVETIPPDRAYPRHLKKVRVPGFQPQYRRTR